MPNTRESVRKLTIHQFLDAGLIVINPDKPDRAINSGGTVYQIAPAALDLLRKFSTEEWDAELADFKRLRLDDHDAHLGELYLYDTNYQHQFRYHQRSSDCFRTGEQHDYFRPG
jgi:hypothetical protein